MEKDKKKPVFVHQPEYPGGPKELSKFIQQNLRYPAAALEAGEEGTVYVEYDIDYQGNVVSTRVLQGVSGACDEEACRVVRLLKFDVPKNRGMKVVFHKKARIQFKKPVAQPVPAQPAGMQVQYTFTPTPAVPADKQAEKPAAVTYSYSYTIG